MSQEPLADVRDMYMAHTMFRREIGRAAIVADHLRIVDTSLHHHHVAEDKHLWPQLIERVGEDAEPVVRVMEEQHGGLDKLLDEVRAGLAQWRGTADKALGAALAETT